MVIMPVYHAASCFGGKNSLGKNSLATPERCVTLPFVCCSNGYACTKSAFGFVLFCANAISGLIAMVMG